MRAIKLLLMKTTLQLLLSSLFLLCVLTLNAQDWTTFQSYESRFKILTPGPLVHQVDTVKTAIGTLDYHIYYYENAAKDAEINFFMVSYCSYPEGTVHADSTALLSEFFQTTIDAAVESMDGDLIYVDSLTRGDYPARTWRIDYLDDHYTVKTQAIVQENNYYAVQVIGPKSKTVNRSSTKFFDSLVIFEE